MDSFITWEICPPLRLQHKQYAHYHKYMDVQQ